MKLIAIAMFGLPLAAWADVSGNVLLQTNTAPNLDAGRIASSGGDILWTGSSIAPQGSSRAYSVGGGGLTGCLLEGLSYYQNFEKAASSAAIPNAKLGAGSSFMVVTAGGNLARVCILSNSGGSIAFMFTTFGAAAAPGVPLISQILNNSGMIPFGQPNYGIAPSSIFAVQGSNLADPGVPVLQSSAAPGLSLTLNGASLTAVVNGVTTHPAIYYTSPGQIAAVLPAATPAGTGTLTVTYNGVTSAPATLVVTPTALGINNYGDANSGVVTDAFTGALFTTANSVWATGLGADPADSDSVYTTTPHAVNAPLQIYVGGVQATVLYAGSAGYPGVNQINVTLPANTPTGCWVPMVAVTGGTIANVVTIPINNGGGACVDALTGLNGAQVSNGSQTLRAGLVDVLHTVSQGSAGTTNAADAAFEKYTGVYTPSVALSPGGCWVGPVVASPTHTITGMDVGTITLTGPNSLNVTMASQLGIKGAFYSSLGANDIPSTGGTFTFKGSGGADVGSFTATVTFANPLMTVTSPSNSATIN